MTRGGIQDKKNSKYIRAIILHYFLFTICLTVVIVAMAFAFAALISKLGGDKILIFEITSAFLLVVATFMWRLQTAISSVFDI